MNCRFPTPARTSSVRRTWASWSWDWWSYSSSIPPRWRPTRVIPKTTAPWSTCCTRSTWRNRLGLLCRANRYVINSYSIHKPHVYAWDWWSYSSSTLPRWRPTCVIPKTTAPWNTCCTRSTWRNRLGRRCRANRYVIDLAMSPNRRTIRNEDPRQIVLQC